MKLCCVFNTAPHYRKRIYELMDQEFDCVWAVGHLDEIRDLDMSGFRGELVNLANKKLISNFYWQRGALKQAFRRDIDNYLLLGDSYNISVWLISLIARLRGKKLAYWSHGWYGKERGIKKIVSRIFWLLPNKGFIYNNYSRSVMEAAGMPKDKLVTIYNSLDYDSQVAIRNTLTPSSIYADHFGDNNPVLIFIGRLTAVKRLDLMIEALGMLKERDQEYNLVLVGDGPEKEKLEALIRKKRLSDNVWLYGACYDERENAELIYNADLCVAPGNIGLTSIHVMTFGTPAATHRNLPYQMPEFEAIEEDKTGFFFDYLDAQSIADGISKWFSHNRDREEIRQACYQVIDDKWNPHNQINILKESL